jgi:hypothetical protein
MKTRNCKTACREIEEAGLGEQLGKLTLSHLSDCEECRSFRDSRFKLRQMVGSLETIEAPADFDFRLRARLASESLQPSRFSIGGFSFGLRSFVLPTLLLLVGAGFVLRVLLPEGNKSTSVSVETRNIDRAASNQGSQVTTAGPVTTPEAPKPWDTRRHSSNATAMRGGGPRKASGRTAIATLRHNSRTVTREFSSLPAAVIKRQDSVASVDPLSVFPISASSQSLKLSLDDGSGVLRTISLPTVSFGSQRVLNQDGLLMMKTSRGAW